MNEGNTPFRFPAYRFIRDACAIYAGRFGPLFLGHLVVALILNLGGFLALPVAGPLTAGLMCMSLKAVRGEAVRFEDTFALFNRFVPTMMLGLVQWGIIMGALVLFGLPTLVGLIWALFLENRLAFMSIFFFGMMLTLLPMVYVLFYFTPSWFYILDERVGWAEAMRKSRALVMRQRGAWTGFLVPVSLVHLAFLITCVGYLLATPWLLVCFALAFDYQVRSEAVLRED